MEYRHEIKFLVTDQQLLLINFRLSSFMKRDAHQAGDYYTITSLYFDDHTDRFLKENLNGEDYRVKYRIRLYNNSPNTIHLEKKSKIHGMTRKEIISITLDECISIINGNISIRDPDPKDNKVSLYAEMILNGVFPKIVVEYDRSAFINRVGNVRITFDKNIRATTKINEFLKPRIYTHPILPTGYHILEIKYDELLPSYIYDLLDDGNLQQTAFSKYSYAREMEELYNDRIY